MELLLKIDEQTLFFVGCCLFIYAGFSETNSKFNNDSEYIFLIEK